MGIVLRTGVGEKDPVLLSVPSLPLYTALSRNEKKKKGMYKMVCVCGKGAVLAPSPLFPVSSSLLEVWACWGT